MIHRKLIRIFCSLMFVIITAAGCSSIPASASTAQPSQTAVNVDLGFKKRIVRSTSIEDTFPMAQPGGGFGLQLFDKNGNEYAGRIIESGENIEYFLTLYSFIPREESYKLLQFVDFQQTPIIVDDIAYDIGFDFDMPPNGIIDIPISVQGLKPGLHEILYVFVVSAKNKSLDEEQRLRAMTKNLKFSRIFISVNGDQAPALDIRYISPPLIKDQNDFSTVWLNRNKDALVAWLTDTVKPREIIPCYLHIGSGQSTDKQQYAVIVLNEWKQVEIDKGSNVLFLELDPNKEAIIDMELTMPAEEGIYDVAPILISSPYDSSLGKRTQTSYRTGIVVSIDKK